MENLELLMFGPLLLALVLGFLTPWVIFYLVKRRTKSGWRAGACAFASPVMAFLTGGTICAFPRTVLNGDLWDLGDWFLAGGNAGAFAAGFGLFWLYAYSVVYVAGRTTEHNVPASPFFPPVTTQLPDDRDS
jgi:hypothetical protein